MKTRRHLGDGVTVAHPDGQLAMEAVEQRARLADRDERRTVLVGAAGVDLAAEMMGDQLHPVADAQHGNARAQSLGLDCAS